MITKFQIIYFFFRLITIIFIIIRLFTLDQNHRLITSRSHRLKSPQHSRVPQNELELRRHRFGVQGVAAARARDALGVEDAQRLGHRLELGDAGVEAAGVDGGAEDGVHVGEQLVAGVEGDEAGGAADEVGADRDAEHEEEHGRARDDLGDGGGVGAVAEELGAELVHFGELEIDRGGGDVRGKPLAVLAQQFAAFDGAQEADFGKKRDGGLLGAEKRLGQNCALEERPEGRAEDIADWHVAQELTADFVEVDSCWGMRDSSTFGDDVRRNERMLLLLSEDEVFVIIIIIIIITRKMCLFLVAIIVTTIWCFFRIFMFVVKIISFCVVGSTNRIH